MGGPLGCRAGARRGHALHAALRLCSALPSRVQIGPSASFRCAPLLHRESTRASQQDACASCGHVLYGSKSLWRLRRGKRCFTPCGGQLKASRAACLAPLLSPASAWAGKLKRSANFGMLKIEAKIGASVDASVSGTPIRNKRGLKSIPHPQRARAEGRGQRATLSSQRQLA